MGGWTRVFRGWVWVAFLASGCSGSACLTTLKPVLCRTPMYETTALCAIEEGVCVRGRFDGEFEIQVMDSETEAPMEGVVASVEVGCLYCPNHNSYELGGISDANGIIRIRTDFSGILGFHTFQNGYLYGRASCQTTRFNKTVINMRRLNGEIPPVLSNLRAEPSTVAPGGTFTLRVDLTSSPETTNSDETLWVEPVEGRSGRIKPDTGDPDNPPNKEFPEGPYSVVVTAPQAPGSYEYLVHTTAENCVTSDRRIVRVTVQ